MLASADERAVVGGGQHQRERGAYERVVVDDEDADHVVHGSQAQRRYSPVVVIPCSSRPPASSARSVSPISPAPAPGILPLRRPTASGLRTSISSPAPGPPDTLTSTAVSRACLRALVSPSCTIR